MPLWSQLRPQHIRYVKTFVHEVHIDSQWNIQRFVREALVWKQLKHENVLPFLGVFWHYMRGLEYPCMISPWIEDKTIMHYVRKENYFPSMRGPLVSGHCH
jgi:serine/threonine protein kinase